MDYVTLIGFGGAFGTTVAFLPQAVKTLKTRHTKDLSLGMYSIFTVGLFLWLVYGLLVGDLPLILANAVTFVLSSVILGMKIKYG